MQLSWSDPENDTITHYRVLRRNTSPGVQDTMQTLTANTGSNATSYTDSTAEPETRYKYKIAAINANGQSRRSRAATITTPVNAPGKVQDVSATQEDADSAVNITWTAADTATTYQVERKTTSNLLIDPVVADVAAPTISYDDTDTEYDTEYLYRVRAGNVSGYGEWSDLDRITTAREQGTPAAPASVQLSQETGEPVVISWQDPPGDEAVNGYRLYRKTVATGTDVQLASLNGTTTTYEDNTVWEETWYTYWVIAYNDVGDSPHSSWQSIETKLAPGLPESPASLSLSEHTAGEIVATWTAATSGPTPTGYKVYRDLLGSNGVLIGTVNADTLTFTDTTAETDTWYKYWVRGYNDAGDGNKSITRYIHTEE